MEPNLFVIKYLTCKSAEINFSYIVSASCGFSVLYVSPHFFPLQLCFTQETRVRIFKALRKTYIPSGRLLFRALSRSFSSVYTKQLVEHNNHLQLPCWRTPCGYWSLAKCVYVVVVLLKYATFNLTTTVVGFLKIILIS